MGDLAERIRHLSRHESGKIYSTEAIAMNLELAYFCVNMVSSMDQLKVERRRNRVIISTIEEALNCSEYKE